jgi:hypothetical protein
MPNSTGTWGDFLTLDHSNCFTYSQQFIPIDIPTPLSAPPTIHPYTEQELREQNLNYYKQLSNELTIILIEVAQKILGYKDYKQCKTQGTLGKNAIYNNAYFWETELEFLQRLVRISKENAQLLRDAGGEDIFF